MVKTIYFRSHIKRADQVMFQNEENRSVIKRVNKLKKIAKGTEEIEIDPDEDYDKRMKEILG